MEYSLVDTLDQKALAEQIAGCQEQLSWHQAQWEKLQNYPGDKTVFILAIKSAQDRLEQLL